MCVTLKYSVDKHLTWVDTTKSAHMNGHWKAYDIQNLNDHIVEIFMKYYTEFQSVQSMILRWS